jgi:septum site-determining protein MinC
MLESRHWNRTMAKQLDIKGIRDGLLIHVPGGDWVEVHPTLLGSIDERREFFRGARVALQLSDRELNAGELGRLRDELGDRELRLWAVLSNSPVTREAAVNLGLDISLKQPARAAAPEQPPFDTELLGEAAVLVQRTVRSGNSLRHPGHVVVLGDVNPGAEIVAGGHVIVWGKLRGTVHAGAAGSEDAIVCALDLAPTQLRIASHVAVSPERGGRGRPEIARLREGRVVAEYWSASTRG